MSLARRRLARIARTGSPSLALGAVLREARLQRARRSVDRALGSGRPLVVGPFLGEVGYELLYWRPYVHRLLRERKVDPGRVTVLGRGGSGRWYAGVAARAIDAFELVSVEDVRLGMEARAATTGQRKQVTADDLDRRLLRLAGPGDDLHPLHMYLRSRFLWEGLRPPEDAPALGDYDRLPELELDPGIRQRLPERFIAVKAYFNECLPDGPDVRRRLADVVRVVSEILPVVALEPGRAVDDHHDWQPDDDRVVGVADLLDPARNLAQQAAVVAQAEALVSTYGGFSYLGPFTGVPTVAFALQREANPVHERVLRAALPESRYVRVDLDPDAIVRAVAG